MTGRLPNSGHGRASTHRIPAARIRRLLTLLLAGASVVHSADSPPLEAELAAVRAQITALPAAETAQSIERRELLDGLEHAISRELAATSALAVNEAQREDLDRQIEGAVPVPPAPVGPEVIDRLFAAVVSAERDLVGATTLVDMLDDQSLAERERLEEILALERAAVEDDAAALDERAMAHVRLQHAKAMLGATTAEHANAKVLRANAERVAAIARRRALAAAGLRLDEAALATYLADERAALERLTQEGLDRMKALASRQRALAEARRARDEASAGGDERIVEQNRWRFEAEHSAVERLELETIAQRVGSEIAEVTIEVWNSRAAMMRGSLRALPDVERLIERSEARAAAVRQRFVSTQVRVQESLDALELELERRPPGDATRHWLDLQRRELRAVRVLALRVFSDLDAFQVFLDGSRFHLEYLSEHQSLHGWLRDVFGQLWQTLRAIWNYEILTIEDTIDVDGEKITGQLAITVEKVATAVLLLTAGIWLAAVIAGTMRTRLVRRGVSETAAALTYRLLNLVSVVVLVIAALSVVDIPLTVLGFVGGALALGVGLGAQNLVNNFISGLILLIERPIKIGDIIDLDGVRGTVTRIAGRFSQIRRFDGVDLLIPNSVLLERQFENLTRDDSNIRLTLRVGVAYGSPTRATGDCLLAAAREHGRVLHEPPPFVLFEDFGDSALVFSLNVWVRLQPKVNSLVTLSDLRYMIERNLRAAGIEVAYPTRDVHIDIARPVKVEFLAEQATPPEPPSREHKLSEVVADHSHAARIASIP